ncbi:unnamed protein product [Cylicocyclus nassatus]|uniref:Uncharacterized protein n=1 Tax=Cylicocyclus nassatus TaxID=53992 RepID=A0AA36HGK0_CYLNA|nr:unnamed protein product [Cylicocyclus nassatus]
MAKLQKNVLREQYKRLHDKQLIVINRPVHSKAMILQILVMCAFLSSVVTIHLRPSFVDDIRTIDLLCGGDVVSMQMRYIL